MLVDIINVMADSKEIRSFGLGNLIKEAVTLALFEQEVLGQQPPPVQPAAANPVPPAAPPLPEEVPQEPQNVASQQTLMTIDTMIERLNVIRGGKSFTDPEVYGQIVSYFKKMTPEQNQIIDQYLQDVSRIMINVRAGIADQDPNQNTDQGLPPPNTSGTPQPVPGGAQQPPISAGGGATSPPPAPVTGI